MVILRSRSLDTVLVAIIAGTVQPKPISIGTKLRPDRPSRRMGASSAMATRAISPLSSNKPISRNNSRMAGKKLTTAPTPANAPLISRSRSSGAVPARVDLQASLFNQNFKKVC